jgi:thiol-disulfide isomerase/thioredoxin
MTTATGRVRAPELRGSGGWINTDISPSLRELRGRVVVLDFWTFCCINCLRVIEELRDLEQRFGDRLVVIGVHSPKFPHESDHAAVVRAVTRHRIAHPVLSADPPSLLAPGPRSWALDTLPVAVEVRLGSAGSGVLVVDLIAATCAGDVCTIARATREHRLTVG